jgi:hypothetical protein
MAKVIFFGDLGSITGKLGGSVFQWSYGGFQIRTKSSPRNPQTSFQQVRRGDFSYLSAQWRSLTEVQRQTFIDGAITPGGGFDLFVSANTNLTLLNQPHISTYIPGAVLDNIALEFVEASDTDLTVQAFTALKIVPADRSLLVAITNPKAPTHVFNSPSDYSPIIAFGPGTDLSAPVSIFAEYTARFGQLDLDKRICMIDTIISTVNGRRGEPGTKCVITELP